MCEGAVVIGIKFEAQSCNTDAESCEGEGGEEREVTEEGGFGGPRLVVQIWGHGHHHLLRRFGTYTQEETGDRYQVRRDIHEEHPRPGRWNCFHSPRVGCVV